jgi:2-oxoacid:acceptor oxidoreductase gamma subunit (pyruvate/2-ketoisovalerate family)
MNGTKTDLKDKEGRITSLDDQQGLLRVELPLEIRVHGRGGQGGVTCAKLCALMYSNLGLFAQTFGDYGMERTGAPVRAYTRVDHVPIKNRNKVYVPGHLLILDPSLVGEGILDGVLPGALMLLNTQEGLSAFRGMYEQFRFATVDATGIARKHDIGSSAVVIVNTAIVGAYARLVGLPIRSIEETYSALGLHGDIGAAQDAYHSVAVRETSNLHDVPTAAPAAVLRTTAQVIALTDHTADMPTPLKTGWWRTQSPRYRTLQAPCHISCPAGNDIAGFLQELKQNGAEEAAQVLAKTQPLPSVCGRVCPAPCMTSCNRATHDGPVNIRGLERWVGDHSAGRLLDVETCPSPQKMAIVGGGPAGLAAAFALARAGHNLTIYESQPKLGGLLRSAIPSYRLPEDALDRDIHRMMQLGLKAHCGEPLDQRRIEELAAAYDAVVVTTGQARSRALDCAGVDLSGVEQGLEFLRRVKVEGGVKISGAVIVIGGGNTALDCARTAVRCGATKVRIVYRRGREEMPAIEEEIEETVAEGVELIPRRQPVRFRGKGRVTEIEFAEVKLGPPDASGRKRPLVTDRLSTIPCDHVLLAAGQYSDPEIFPSQWTIGEGRAYLCNQPMNVWLAGDLTTGAGTVAHAVGHGRKVAEDILDSLADRPMADVQVCTPVPNVASAEDIRLSHFPLTARHQDQHMPVASRISAFHEVNMGLANDLEAQRCFSCGHCTQCDTCLTYCPEGIISRSTGSYVINEEYCKGCGICVWECPRNAMQMTPQGYRSRP